jgi:hypothetical protein
MRGPGLRGEDAGTWPAWRGCGHRSCLERMPEPVLRGVDVGTGPACKGCWEGKRTPGTNRPTQTGMSRARWAHPPAMLVAASFYSQICPGLLARSRPHYDLTRRTCRECCPLPHMENLPRMLSIVVHGEPAANAVHCRTWRTCRE